MQEQVTSLQAQSQQVRQQLQDDPQAAGEDMQALAQSPNTAFIKLEEFTGVPDVVDMAVRLGMKSLATTPFVDPNTGRLLADMGRRVATLRQQRLQCVLELLSFGVPAAVIESVTH